MSQIELQGKKILVTGVSRPSGIGATLAKRFAQAGASVAVHGYSGYDQAVQYADAEENATQKLADILLAQGLDVAPLPASDLSAAGVPESVIAEAMHRLGGLDGLILNHAYSTCVPVGEWTAQHIDTHFQVNVRASMLLIQAFAAQAQPDRDNVITLFTSGQYLGPMTKEIAYAASKDAIICLCKQTAAALAPSIRVNCINPGPNDTGYLTGEAYQSVAKLFPAGRWGTPEDTADLALFLHSEYSKWITGQVIASEGGFRRDGIVT